MPSGYGIHAISQSLFLDAQITKACETQHDQIYTSDHEGSLEGRMSFEIVLMQTEQSKLLEGSITLHVSRLKPTEPDMLA